MTTDDSIDLGPVELDALDALAAAHGLTRSETLRKLITEALHRAGMGDTDRPAGDTG